MFGGACRIGWVSRDLGGSTEVVKVVRKLQRVGSNGLHAAKNNPAPSYQLAHLTGTTIEFQLRLEPIYLCDQLYPRFFNRPVQCAQFGGLPLKVARSFANRRVRMYLRTARDLSKGTLLLAECAPCFRIRRQTVCSRSQHNEAVGDVLGDSLDVLLVLIEIKLKLLQFLIPPSKAIARATISRRRCRTSLDADRRGDSATIGIVMM
jgi:hypothetical protein